MTGIFALKLFTSLRRKALSLDNILVMFWKVTVESLAFLLVQDLFILA